METQDEVDILRANNAILHQELEALKDKVKELDTVLLAVCKQIMFMQNSRIVLYESDEDDEDWAVPEGTTIN